MYDKALELDPDFFLAKQWRAYALQGNEAYVEVDNIEKLSDYEKLHIQAQEALTMGDFAKLLEIGDQMLALRPSNWIALNYKYAAEYFLGFYEKAAQTCERTIRSGYRTSPDHLVLNSAYVMSGLSPTEIIERYRTLLKEDPSDVMMQFWLALTYITVNRDREAQELLDSVFDVHPDSDGLMWLLSDTYAWREGPDKTEDYLRAMEYLRQIRQLRIKPSDSEVVQHVDPDSDDWLLIGVPLSFRIGEVYLLQGNIEKAAEAFERSLDLKPDHYNSFYRLGIVYELLGKTDKAIANLEKFIAVTDLNAYDATALGRESSCAATKVCHSISRPDALADARQRLKRLR
jgi:tetratricopeptide (TPR) repeat protein